MLNIFTFNFEVFSFFHQYLIVYSVQIFHLLIKFIPRYCILFDEIINEIVCRIQLIQLILAFFLIHPFFLIEEFSSFTFKIIDSYGLTIPIFCLFSASFVTPLFFSLFLSEFIIFCSTCLYSFLYLFYIYYRFFLCGYHEMYIRYCRFIAVCFKLIITLNTY